MAIENLDNNNQVQLAGGDELVPVAASFQANNVLIASMQRVRHPLIGEMLVYGFLGQTEGNVDFKSIQINGLNAHFKDSLTDTKSFDYGIYTKVLIDLQQNNFHDLFSELTYIDYTCSGSARGHINHSEGLKYANKRNFYFFKNRYDATPQVFSDEIYLVCKYRENGDFKCGVFAPHEVTFEK